MEEFLDLVIPKADTDQPSSAPAVPRDEAPSIAGMIGSAAAASSVGHHRPLKLLAEHAARAALLACGKDVQRAASDDEEVAEILQGPVLHWVDESESQLRSEANNFE